MSHSSTDAEPQHAEPPQTLKVGTAAKSRSIAYRQNPSKRDDGLGLIWLAGLKSDMLSTKASALAEWAPLQGLGLTRFDYSGHGESSGRFEDAVISDWVEEAGTILEKVTTGPQILVGSSTGGQVGLVLLRQLLRSAPEQASRIKGLVLIAPAWDLTEELMWAKFPEDGRQAILQQGYYDMPSDYGEPYRITRAFIEDGRRDLIKPDPFNPGCPIRVLQGVLDDAVPVDHTRALPDILLGDWVHITEIPEGDHRLSRPEDIELLFSEVLDVTR
ncbi:MAG: alpha/beta hydrolase [Pseudomonadota bacterium]